MKQKIIEVTVELLEKFGTKFTVDDVASKLGASKKTIYKYFKSKEELAESVFDFIYINANANQNMLAESDLAKKEKLIKCILEYLNILKITVNTIYGNYRLSDILYNKYLAIAENNWDDIARNYLLQDVEYYKHIIDGLAKNVSNKKVQTSFYEKCLRIIFSEFQEAN